MASPRIDELGERLGIVLRDPEAIRQAFVHSSFLNENPGAASGHNERLEFLGDAVIGHVVSRLLYDRFPDEDEGLLDRPTRRAREPRLAGRALPWASGSTDTSCWAEARPEAVAPLVRRSWRRPSRLWPARWPCAKGSVRRSAGCAASLDRSSHQPGPRSRQSRRRAGSRSGRSATIARSLATRWRR